MMPFYLYVTKSFIEFLRDPDADTSHGLLLMGLLFTLMFVTLLSTHYF